MLRFVKHEKLEWVQDRIAEDPLMLGLGDVVLKDKERIQPRAGHNYLESGSRAPAP